MKTNNIDLNKNGSGYSDPTAAFAIANCDKCFANNKGRCRILNVGKCQEEGCSFLKTSIHFNTEQKKVLIEIYNLKI